MYVQVIFDSFTFDSKKKSFLQWKMEHYNDTGV